MIKPPMIFQSSAFAVPWPAFAQYTGRSYDLSMRASIPLPVIFVEREDTWN
jgi:hypothetical protein